MQILVRTAVLALATWLLFTHASRAQVTVDLGINNQFPGHSIPADFLGLSFEMQRVLADTNGWHFFSPDNQPLIATFKTLGIKNLRVGGNTADRPTLPVPTDADVDALFQFAKAADITVLFTLRLNQGTPEAAADRAAYILKHYPDQLSCFAIGNEPNVFSTNYDVYIAEWKRFAAVINSNCPTARFCGPSVSPGHEKWSARFASDPEIRPRLAFVSQHDYPGGDARSVKDPALGRDKILSPAIAEHYAKFANNFVPTVLSNGLPYRFEEANSFYDGGASNVSDTFASALWALNYQWWWVSHGMCGINFHTGDKVAARDENKPCRYASFWSVTNGYNIHPIAYAEKMFSLGSQGRLLRTEFAPGFSNSWVTAYGVLGDDHCVYATLINTSHGATATNATVIVGTHLEGYARGETMILSAPGGDVSAKTGITLGGGGISDDAKWNGTWNQIPVPAEHFQFAVEVNVPAASAVLVKLTPR